MKLIDKIKFALTGLTRSPDFNGDLDSYLRDHIESVFRENEGLLLTDISKKKIERLMDRYNIEPIFESETELEPGFLIANRILLDAIYEKKLKKHVMHKELEKWFDEIERPIFGPSTPEGNTR